MANQSDLFCFQCGQTISDPPTINELPGGGSCPGCAERALASAPSLLPSRAERELDEGELEVEELTVPGGGASGRPQGPRAYDSPPEPA